MKILDGLKRRVPRTIRGRIFAVLAIYIALVLAESLFLSKVVDRYVLSRPGIFEDYVARLPKPFVFPDLSKINYTNCEYHNVALLYRFEICSLYSVQRQVCSKPNYMVRYMSPARYLNPLRSTFIDRTIGGTPILQFDSTLNICYSYLEG
ncbi:hypothetical protein [Phaeovulum sp.]|uniref:hypothetical protein n=1 Tax=Phaeovulum sp. TaxID=2934796 RepID=UPI00272F06B6|nr:hypothetical protein [Phaeovulum sp.]MDP1668669.1 hypothetical protein [Phaeovulum sp.]MDZ4119843.1 hypothetical protein [Phaeovulum sp.]